MNARVCVFVCMPRCSLNQYLWLRRLISKNFSVMLQVIIQRIKGKRGGDREHERRHVIVDESVVCDGEKFQKGNSPAEREREWEKRQETK